MSTKLEAELEECKASLNENSKCAQIHVTC